MAPLTRNDKQIAWTLGVGTLVLIPILALTTHRIDLRWTDDAVRRPRSVQGYLSFGLKRGTEPYKLITRDHHRIFINCEPTFWLNNSCLDQFAPIIANELIDVVLVHDPKYSNPEQGNLIMRVTEGSRDLVSEDHQLKLMKQDREYFAAHQTWVTLRTTS